MLHKRSVCDPPDWRGEARGSSLFHLCGQTRRHLGRHRGRFEAPAERNVHTLFNQRRFAEQPGHCSSGRQRGNVVGRNGGGPATTRFCIRHLLQCVVLQRPAEQAGAMHPQGSRGQSLDWHRSCRNTAQEGGRLDQLHDPRWAPGGSCGFYHGRPRWEHLDRFRQRRIAPFAEWQIHSFWPEGSAVRRCGVVRA